MVTGPGHKMKIRIWLDRIDLYGFLLGNSQECACGDDEYVVQTFLNFTTSLGFKEPDANVTRSCGAADLGSELILTQQAMCIDPERTTEGSQDKRSAGICWFKGRFEYGVLFSKPCSVKQGNPSCWRPRRAAWLINRF